MFSWLKKHFIPHKDNDHRPHILRDSSIHNIVAVVIFLEIFTFLIPTFTHLNTTGNMAAVLPAVLTDLTNEKRQSQNLPTLAINPILNKAAEMKAKDMAAKGYFAHTSPEGKTPWYWLAQVGYQYQYAGENLAINFSDSKDVTDAWIASPTHKANIVKGNYTEIGTGIARGVYKGKETIFVAQVYANPLPKTAEKIQPAKIISKSKPEMERSKSAVVKETAKNVLGAEAVSDTIKSAQNFTFWQKLLASPRNTANIFLYAVFGIIFFSLLLYIFVKIKNHHKDLILNGLVALAIIGAIFSANYYLSYRDTVTAESIDYSSENN